jgi:colanic acid/amylovoran biosynthesis protein
VVLDPVPRHWSYPGRCDPARSVCLIAHWPNGVDPGYRGPSLSVKDVRRIGNFNFVGRLWHSSGPPVGLSVRPIRAPMSCRSESDPTMKILVVNGIQRETVGDAALLTVLLDQLERAFPGCEIDISSLENPREHPTFRHWRNLGSLRRWSASEEISRPNRMLRKVFVTCLAFLWFRRPRAVYRFIARLFPAEVRAELQSVESADLVVSCSGGYLNATGTVSGDLSVYCTLAPITLAERLGIPVIFAPQSVGPFGHERQRRCAQRALRGANLVLVREDVSYALVESLGVTPPTLRRGVDSAFAFRPGPGDEWRETLSLRSDEVVVGMTARVWLSPPRQELLDRTLARFIDHVHRNPGFRVVLIPQNTSELAGEDDRDLNRRIAGYCRGDRTPVLVEERCDPTEITGLYSSLDFLVGMRFHSVIFALTGYVPSMTIEYHYKSRGIMRDLGLEEWVLALDDATEDQIVSLFDRLVHQKREYEAHLRRVLPAYVAQADGVWELIRDVYDAPPGRSLPREPTSP